MLAMLVSHWEGLCRREEATFLKVRTVNLVQQMYMLMRDAEGRKK